MTKTDAKWTRYLARVAYLEHDAQYFCRRSGDSAVVVARAYDAHDHFLQSLRIFVFFFLWMSEKQQKLKRRERSLFLFLDKYERRQRERRQFTFAVCVACDFVFFFFLSGVFHMCRNEFSVEIVFVSLSLIFALIWHDYCLIRRSTRYDFCRALSIFVTKRNEWQTRKCTSFSISATRKSTLLKSKQSDYDDENQTEWYPFIYYCYSFKRVPSDKDSNVFFGFRFRKIFSCFSHRYQCFFFHTWQQ